MNVITIETVKRYGFTILPQRLKYTRVLFPWNSGLLHSNFFFKTLILAFEANSGFLPKCVICRILAPCVVVQMLIESSVISVDSTRSRYVSIPRCRSGVILCKQDSEDIFSPSIIPYHNHQHVVLKNPKKVKFIEG